MAIGAFTEGAARLSNRGNLEYNSNGSIVSYVDEYTVVMADISALASKRNVTGLPKEGQQSDWFDKMYAAEFSFNRTSENSRVWKISVTYRVGAVGMGTSSSKSNILKSLSYEPYTATQDFTVDQITKKPVVNTAKDAFDLVPQIEVSDLAVHFKIAAKKLHTDLLEANCTVNKSDYKIYGIKFPKHCGLLEISCEDTLGDEGFRYLYDVKISRRSNNRVNIYPDGDTELGWDISVANVGFHRRDGDKLVAIQLEDDSSPKMPVPLNASGTDVYTDTQNGCLMLKFSPYKEFDFSKLDALDVSSGIPSV